MSAYRCDKLLADQVSSHQAVMPFFQRNQRKPANNKLRYTWPGQCKVHNPQWCILPPITITLLTHIYSKTHWTCIAAMLVCVHLNHSRRNRSTGYLMVKVIRSNCMLCNNRQSGQTSVKNMLATCCLIVIINITIHHLRSLPCLSCTSMETCRI